MQIKTQNKDKKKNETSEQTEDCKNRRLTQKLQLLYIPQQDC